MTTLTLYITRTRTTLFGSFEFEIIALTSFEIIMFVADSITYTNYIYFFSFLYQSQRQLVVVISKEGVVAKTMPHAHGVPRDDDDDDDDDRCKR